MPNYDFLGIDFSIFLEPSVVLLTGILTCLVTKNSNKHAIALERLQYAYHPLFLLAEPYLYKEISFEYANIFVAQFNKISSEYSLYIYPSLRYWITLMDTSVKTLNYSDMQEYWTEICRYIDHDYDKLCKRSHMPLRSSAYRLNTKEYETKTKMWLYTIKLGFLPFLVYLLAAMLMMYFISTANS